MIARLVFLLLFALPGVMPAAALEIYRNSVRYDIVARLPGGADYVVDGVDRKFALPGVSGNLRLIQDEYSSCEGLVDERRQNWIKYGFNVSYGRYVSRSECTITIESPAENKAISSYYVRVDHCGCYAALHLSYSADNRNPFMTAAPEIVGSLRSNNSGKAGPDFPSLAETPVAAAESAPAPVVEADITPMMKAIVEPEAPAALATRELQRGEGLKRVSQALASFSCLSADDVNKQRQRALVALSAWSGKTIQTLGSEAGNSRFADMIEQTYDFATIEERDKSAIDAVLAAHPDVIAALEQDAKTYGDRLCQILNVGLEQGPLDLARRQSEFRSVYHDYLIAAQRLMELHHCSDAEIDGAFGPASRNNWNRMLIGLGLPVQDDSYTPGISDLARIADIKVTAPACDSGSRPAGLAVSPLRFLANAGHGSHWLEILDDDLASVMDEMASAGEWTPWHSELALRLFRKSDEGALGTRERLLSDMYQNGIGVKVNRQAADHWRALGARDKTPYSLYLAALSDPSRIPEAVRVLSHAGAENYYDSGGTVPAGPIMVPFAALIGLPEYADLARIATLVIRHPLALDEVLKTTEAPYQYKLAERLLEGASIDGKGAEQAAILLEAAANTGADYAASRLAFMLQYGLGAPADLQKARKFAEMAAAAKETFALFQLARLAEKDQPSDPKSALAAYQRLFKEARNDNPTNFLRWLISNQIDNGSLALTSIDGDQLTRKFGFKGSGVVDLAETARLLREQDTNEVDYDRKSKNYELFQLITEHPELAKSKNEALQLLEANVSPPESGSVLPFGTRSDLRSLLAASIIIARKDYGDEAASVVTGFLDLLCTEETVRNHFCESAAKLLASGEFGGSLVDVGIARLRQEDSLYLIDILAAYGDFRGALDRALRQEREDRNSFFLGSTQNASAPVFRRLMSRRSMADMATLPDGVEDLLRFYARHGDTTARNYLELIATPQRSPGPPASPDLNESFAAFELAAARGGLSRGLVNAAREYSKALESKGQREQALRLELTALSAEIQLDDIDAFGQTAFGAPPLDASLTNICHLSRSSERAFSLGSDDLALVLAKDAINRLQEIRGNLSNVSERLQACFRDLVSDNYRWLADLLVRQDRLGEAQFVLGLLKDYETFQFTGRDQEFSGEAFAQLPYSTQEQALKTALSQLAPPTVPEARRVAQLRAQDALKGLSSAQKKELSEIEAKLAEAKASHESGLDAILAVASSVNQSELSGFQAGLGLVDKFVESNPEEQAAALHYLVLPDRLSIILTTHDKRVSHVITEWKGKPFREARMNEEIAELHKAFSDPDRDPVPRSRELYDLLIAPVAADLREANARLLLLSLDKRLRYLPFGALHNGMEFLVEGYETSILTNSGYEVSGEKITGAPFAALGMTQETDEFVALPGVAIELDGIVKGADGFGLFDGNVKMDAAFDRPALSDALQIGEPTPSGVGIVHVSSHFALGANDRDSFLLLGTGEHLSLSDIKQDRAAFDFEHVELLTLSACTTGFANPDRDGREIDSLAKITSDRGAKSTLASLWPVADSATAILMQRFYELRELGNMSKAQALAVAQHEFIDGLIGSPDHLRTRSVVFQTAIRTGESFQDKASGIDLGFAHPFYWAPFVLTGNWR